MDPDVSLRLLVRGLLLTILIWLKEGGTSGIPLMFALATILALVPVIPFGVIAGILGAKYGVWVGGLLNVGSSTAAAIIMFLAVRFIFYESGRRYLLKFTSLRKFTLMIEHHAFFSILTARLIPIMPAAAVNIYAALSKIPYLSFLLATALGKIPVMMVFAFVGDQVFQSLENGLFGLAIYTVFLFFVYAGYQYYSKKQSGSRID